MFQNKSLLMFAVIIAVFHFANAPMLALAGQKLAIGHPGFETALLSACILVAQLATIPVALVVGIKADIWGHKRLLIAACLALALRGILFAWFDNVFIIVAAQILDGVGGGILDVLVPLMLANIVRGTGRYSASRGVVSTIQGIGGSLSNVAAGTMVTAVGYNTSFFSLAMIAALGCCVVIFGMREPETKLRKN